MGIFPAGDAHLRLHSAVIFWRSGLSGRKEQTRVSLPFRETILHPLPSITIMGNAICYRSIGTIHSPFRDPEGMPIQPAGACGVEGTVEVLPEFGGGLRDIDGFSRVILIYHFHRSRPFSLDVTPFLDTASHGVFATRAPARPNPVGLSAVRLVRREDNILVVSDLDILDGTPLLDIKPYIPACDAFMEEKTGWFPEGRIAQARSDTRFNNGRQYRE